jgi:hypothetical protein
LLRTTLQWVSVIDGSGNRVSHAVTLPPPRRRLLRSRKIIPALLLAMTLGGCSEASAQSQPCKTIADDKERLACYDKAASGEQSAVEKNTAQIEKSSNARAAESVVSAIDRNLPIAA